MSGLEAGRRVQAKPEISMHIVNPSLKAEASIVTYTILGVP